MYNNKNNQVIKPIGKVSTRSRGDASYESITHDECFQGTLGEALIPRFDVILEKKIYLESCQNFQGFYGRLIPSSASMKSKAHELSHYSG